MAQYSSVAVLGTQWGDEGKGKLVDFLAEQADVVVRFAGGNNAGHTVVVGDDTYKLHLLPSGVLHPGKLCLLGNGVVVDPAALLLEIRGLEQRGGSAAGLRISDRAHLVMPWHQILDKAQEQAAGSNRIGTTGKGIGPSYVDKHARTGLRAGDLLEPEILIERIRQILPRVNAVLTGVYRLSPLDEQVIMERFIEYGQALRPYICDTISLLRDCLAAGQRVLFEGAQATFLDIDYGTYPYVTSSHPTAGGICTGAGVGPHHVGHITGVVKAYTTRVGEGPFPTELFDATGELIREGGQEYGTTTGRARRCGWLDLAMVRYSAWLNSLDSIALTRLDVLDKLPKIRVCTGYLLHGRPISHYPSSLHELSQIEPVYREMPGWQSSTGDCRSWEQLPVAARDYVEMIAQTVGVPVTMVSVGPRREQTIVRQSCFAEN
ncbi:MAG: adenylosuccinate synthase [Negativicutes bacterium]|nr:adenylosuccinate synthase [Negativicutes bacterium]